MCVPKGIFEAALTAALQNKSFPERMRMLLERLDSPDELLDVLLQGVPTRVKKVNYASLTKFMKNRFAYSDVHEVLDLTENMVFNAATASVKCQCTRERYFKTQADADAFAKDGAYWNRDSNTSKNTEYPIVGFHVFEQSFDVPYSELRENGVEFELV